MHYATRRGWTLEFAVIFSSYALFFKFPRVSKERREFCVASSCVATYVHCKYQLFITAVPRENSNADYDAIAAGRFVSPRFIIRRGE